MRGSQVRFLPGSPLDGLRRRREPPFLLWLEHLGWSTRVEHRGWSTPSGVHALVALCCHPESTLVGEGSAVAMHPKARPSPTAAGSGMTGRKGVLFTRTPPGRTPLLFSLSLRTLLHKHRRSVSQHFCHALHNFGCVVTHADHRVGAEFGCVLQHQVESVLARLLT